MDIKQWVGRHVDCNTPVGDLARDMRRKPLEGETLEEVVAEARMRFGACKEALATLRLAAQRAGHDAPRCGAGCSAALRATGKQVVGVSVMDNTGSLLVLRIELARMGLEMVGWKQGSENLDIELSDANGRYTVTVEGVGMRNLLADDIDYFMLTLVFE